MTVGTASIDVFFPDGTGFQDVWVQGVRGATGGVTITASNPIDGLFDSGSAPVDVTPAGFQIASLLADTNTLAADDAFSIRTYSTNGAGAIFTEQPVSAEGPLTITVTSSNASVGVPSSLAQPSTNPVTLDLAVNQSRTPTTVGAGGVAFDALGGGSTTITATAPGFDPAVTTSSQVVNVAQPGITVSPQTWLSSSRLGSGLQGRTRVTLDGSEHGGVTITMTSDDDTILRLAPDGTTAGTASIDVFFPDGTAFQDIWVQGVRGATGTANVTASNPIDGLFDSDSAPVEVTPAGFQIASLLSDTNTLAADDAFYHSHLLNQCRRYIHGATGVRGGPDHNHRDQQRSGCRCSDIDFTAVDQSADDRSCG